MNRRRKRAGRPIQCRWIKKLPEVITFKPCGIPIGLLETVNLTVDELEAIRLADLEGLYQEQAAQKMNVSRQTFGRIVSSAHKKVAEALVIGKLIQIEGGEIMPVKESKKMGAGGFCICPKCEKKIRHRRGVPCQEERCPQCDAKMLRENAYHHNLLKHKREGE